MIKRILIVAALFCSVAESAVCAADNNPPSEVSIKQLLEVTQARQLLDSMMSQIDAMMKNAMTQATQGQHITPEIQKQIETFETEMTAAAKEMLDWNKLEPMYVRIYQKSFTQQDVDGMIAFYKTPAGQAVINKMPVVMQNMMTEMQQMMQPMMQRIQRKQQDVIAQIQAQKKKSGG